MKMKKTPEKNAALRRCQPHILYALAMLGMGIWQLLDWHYGAEDPIWHLLFYLFFMPLCSLAYGIAAGEQRRPWLIPLFAGVMCALVYICMANGGFSLDSNALSGALELSVPSFFAALAGVVIVRVIMWLNRGVRQKKRKTAEPEQCPPDSRV